MTQLGLDEDRHYSVLLGNGDGGMRIRVACGSGTDVSVSQIFGVFIKELEEEGTFDPTKLGPLVIDCPTHGKYLGFLQLLPTGAQAETGGSQVSIPLMLIPLGDVEYVLPLEQARRLSPDQRP